jgi:seryl-tRNA synthetase
MVVYTCVCCKFETNHKNKYERHLSTKKHIDTSIVEDEKYKALEEKYKALEEKYKALEEKYKALEEKYKEEKYKEDDKEEKYKEGDKENDKEDKFLKDQVDSSEDKVYNVADMLSKSQYQTPNVEELILDFHCDDYERNPVDGMIQVLNRIPFKPFQYVNGRWFSKQHNVWSYDKERTFMNHIRHQMTKETVSIFEEHIGDKDLHSEKWLEWILNSFKPLDSSDIKQILRSIR